MLFNFKNKKQWICYGSILLGSLILYSCKENKSEKEASTKTEAVQPTAIEAFILNKNDFATSLKIPGELIAFQQVDLYAKINSYVKKLHVDVGTEVKEGMLLAELEAPEINAQLASAESKLKSQEALYVSSKATYNRLLETSKTPGTISKNDLDVADAKQKSDFAQLEAAKSNYQEILNTKAYLQIRAPFNGIITVRNVSAGAYVGPSGKGSDQPIFTLQQNNKLRLVVSVPESNSAQLKKEAAVVFTVNSFPGESFKANIARLSGTLDLKLRSQHIEMDVINNEKKLLPGMVAEVIIPLKSSQKVFTVPSSAILNATTGIFLISIHDHKTIWNAIKTGRSFDGKTEVFGDLNVGDSIITHAGEEIRNAAPISNFNIKN